MRKIYGLLLFATLFVAGSCGVDVGYDTHYILKSWVQPTSGGELQKLGGVRLYGYSSDTVGWYVASYDDALIGRFTNREDGTTLDPEITGAESEVESFGTATTMQVTGMSRIMVLAVDTENRLYGYTQQEISENLPTMYVSLVFHPWKSGTSYKNGSWQMFNDFYIPDINCRVRPTLQSAEGEDAAAVKGVKIYLFKVDNPNEWAPTSYSEAAAGWLKNTTTGETITSSTSFSGDSAGTVSLSFKPDSYILLAIESRNMCYGTYLFTPDQAGQDIPLCFMPWRTDSPYSSDGWTLYNSVAADQEN